MLFLRSKAQAAKIYAVMGYKLALRKYRRARVTRQLRSATGPVHIRFHSPGNGLFAHLTWILHVTIWAQRNQRTFSVSCTSPNYGSTRANADWLPQIILHRDASPQAQQGRPIVVHEFEDLPFFMEKGAASLDEARTLFERHFVFTESLRNEVNRVKREVFAGRFIIGLHYRGTDKALESKRVPYEVALASLRQALTEATAITGKEAAAFLATDESGMITAATTALAPFQVISMAGVVRSSNGQPVHQDSTAANRPLAEQAMLDSLLLSECDVIVKTASMLSGWSVVFSTPKAVLLLSEPFADRFFFPDNLVAKIARRPGEESQVIRDALKQALTRSDPASALTSSAPAPASTDLRGSPATP